MCTNETYLFIVIFIFFFIFERHCVCNNIMMKRTLLFFYITCVLITSCINTNIHSSRSVSLLSNDVYSFPLFNAAQTGRQMPALGLGVGFYGTNNESYGTYPECGAELVGCGVYTEKAVYTWLSQAGGRRLDCANSYYNHRSVAQGIKQSGVNRADIFILSKVGPTFPLGFNETIQQAMNILEELQTSWIDLLLIHWPSMKRPTQSYMPKSSDPVCNMSNPQTYNEKECRLSTWSAMLVLFNLGITRSIGVSNYNITHLQEIIDAGLPLPSVNQVSFNPYNYRSGRTDLLTFCQKNHIQLVAYSPLGAPDVQQYPVEHEGKATGMSPTLLQDPIIRSLSKIYQRTEAQILLRWIYQLGIASNPRSMNETHMIENLDILSNPFTISDNDMVRIANLAEDSCDVDPDWYECVGNGNFP